MRIVFMGTPEFAATILEDLVHHHEVVAAFTRPDAVRARGGARGASPVKRVAERLGIAVHTPASLKDEEAQRTLAACCPEVICVAAYGAILPRAVLDEPRFGCLNVHASLLPRWRGAAPIERAILAGDTETGVCIMLMEEGLDTGDYCICRTASIGDKTADELSDELANLGSQALLSALVRLQGGAKDWMRQNISGVTYADKIAKHELDLTPADPAQVSRRKVQASSAAHPSRCLLAHRPVTMLALRGMEGGPPLAVPVGDMVPGSVRYVEKRLFIGCSDGVLEVLALKPDGKRAMDARAFCAGVPDIRQGQQTWGAQDV